MPSGQGLRSFLEQFPGGVYAARAQARLAACRRVEESTWSDDTRRLPLMVRSRLKPHPTQEEAQADASARAPKEAAMLCEPFSEGTFRLESVSHEVAQWRCVPRGEEWTCGFDGAAICEVQVRATREREVCGDS